MTEQNDTTAPATTTPAKPAWYSRGFQGLREEQIRMDSGGEPFWFRINDDKPHRVTFVDDDPVGLHMHEYRQGSRFDLHITCARNVFDDPTCCSQLGDRSRTYYELFTVVDLDGYKPKNGPPVKYSLCVLAAKMGSAKAILQEKTDEITLIGANVRCTRTGKKSPKVGDQFKCLNWPAPVGGKHLTAERWAQMYDLVSYRGKKVADLIRQANEDPAKMAALGRIFDLAPLKDSSGRLKEGIIPCFNFLSLYEPKNPKEQTLLLRGASYETFEERAQGLGTGKGGESAPSEPSRTDDVPF